MPCINFNTSPWTSFGANDQICPGDIFTDSAADVTTAVSFRITNGRAFVTSFGGSNRWLAFSNIDCANSIHQTVILTIRFSRPQERVTFRFNFNEQGTRTAEINFFSMPNQTNLVTRQSLVWVNNEFRDVIYDDCCFPIQEITITTDRPENSIDNLCWEISKRRIRIFGLPRSLCLCTLRRMGQAFSSLFGRN